VERLKVVDEVLSAIEYGIENEGEVRLVGFGTFKVKNTKARTARNPRTGETVKVPAKKKVSFKASKGMGGCK
jgi:DNA-binding protein HU-beta